MKDKYTSNYIFKRMDQIDSHRLNKLSHDNIIKEFMNEYDYDPITEMLKINGIEVKIKIDLNCDTNISIVDDIPLLIIGENYFKLKYKESRRFAIYHEIGHARLHQINPLSKTQNMTALNFDYFKHTFLELIKIMKKNNELNDRNVVDVLVLWYNDFMNRLKFLGNKEQVYHRKILRETYKKFIIENKNNIKYDIEKLITEMEADLYASYFTNKNIAKNALKEVIEYLKEYTYDDEKQHTVTTLSHLYNQINNQTTNHEYDKYIYKQAIYDAEIRMKALDLKIKPEIIKSLVWGDNDEM